MSEIKMLHAGAITQVVRAVVPEFEQATGHKVTLHRDTAGALTKLIERRRGVRPRDAHARRHRQAHREGQVRRRQPHRYRARRRRRRGQGRHALAGHRHRSRHSSTRCSRPRSVAYIDPHAGGSSGIYVAGLLEKLGIAKEVNAKAKLIHGGAVATHIANGVAELGVHQISEILPVKGIVLVGPLPKEIQNYTTYAAGSAPTPSSRRRRGR